MIKGAIAAIFLLIAGIAAARRYMNNKRLESAATDVAQQLDAGNLDMETIANELNATIRRKKVNTTNGFTAKLATTAQNNLPKKFTISKVSPGPNGDLVILGNIKLIEDSISYHGNREHEAIYPAWFYIKEMPEENTIEFRSSVPQHKDHQYALEDFADHLFSLA